ncbi:MAG: hypothetical protein PHE04_02430, partial [Bacteroidales bacterium]|nr:hypothetical protein [Bacteroidales bacterium]
MVVTEYYKLKSTYEVLGVHQDNVQTAQLDLMKAKNDIRNNTIEIGEYSTINYSYTRSYVEYIDARNNFFTQYYLLKLLTGSDF